MLATFLIILNCVYKIHCIEYVQGRWYEHIWSQEQGSLWRPKPPAGYYSLGDVIHSSRGQPTFSALFVKPSNNEKEALVVPVASDLVWRKDNELSIFQLEAPYGGYKCLGMIAVKGYVQSPDISQYRCINEKYVIDGEEEVVWKDTLAYPTASLNVAVSVAGSGGISLNHLVVQIQKPMSQTPSVLTLSYLVPGDVDPTSSGPSGLTTLNVKKVEDGKRIWTSLSGIQPNYIELHTPQLSERDASRGYHIVGSSLVMNGYDGNSYALQGTFGKSIAYPVSYSRVWATKEPTPLHLWRAECPDGFSDISLYATITDAMPLNKTVCVNDMLLSKVTNWQLPWTDQKEYVTFWASAPNDEGLEMLSFNFIDDYVAPDEAFTLDKSKINILPKVHVEKYELSKLQLKPHNVTTIKRREIYDFTFDTQVPRSIDPYDYLQDSYKYIKWNGILTTTSNVDSGILLSIYNSDKAGSSMEMGIIIKSVLNQVNHFGVHVSQREELSFLYRNTAKEQLRPGETVRFTFYENEIMMDVPYKAVLSRINSDDSVDTEIIKGNINVVMSTVTYDS